MGSKYLILKVGALGDLSFLLPAIDLIHATDPNAEVTWISGKNYAGLLRQNPRIHRVIAVDETALFKGSLFQKAWETLRLWSSLDFHYDQIWIGHRTLGALFLLRLRSLGRLYQIVRKPSGFLRLLRHEIVVPPLSLNESLAFKTLAEAALHKEIPAAAWRAKWNWIPDSDFSLPKSYLVLHLGGGSNPKTEFHLKQWPHWLSLILSLMEQTQISMIWVGASEELPASQALLASLNLPPSAASRIHSYVGKTNFIELLGILKNAHSFVGVDSGPLHFADALGVPCVGIYGPTSTVSWGLLGNDSTCVRNPVPCSPCYQDDAYFPACPFHHKCMTELQPATVLEKLLPKIGDVAL